MTAAVSRRLMVLCYLSFCVSLLLAGPGKAQTFFIEVHDPIMEEVRGTTLRGSRSIASGDYDHDGWPDIFLARDHWYAPYRLILGHNEDMGRFRDRFSAFQGDTYPSVDKGGGAIFGDYDNDGDLDLFVPVGGIYYYHVNMLLRNDRGVFNDVTLASGLADELPTDNAIWLDYDRDGFLDLYTGNSKPETSPGASDSGVRNKLYRNSGDGTFADVTQEVGLYEELSSQGGGSNGGMVAGDFNDDGWPDLYMGVNYNRNRLYVNDRQGGFKEEMRGDIADPGLAYGVAVGDIDNDGDLDLFQASGSTYFFAPQFRSMMLLNLGEGSFLDVTESVGLTEVSNKNTFTAGLADIDNDGDLDLLTAYMEENYGFLLFFTNQGDGTFVDRTSQLGIDDELSLPCFGDFDLDGFLDVRLFYGTFRGNPNGNHYLRVELVGAESNRNGIGARLIATSGNLRQMREIIGGAGFQQDEMVAHFGLGQHRQVDQLEIRWPSGQVDVLADLPVDQKIRVIEGRETYHAILPTTWEHHPDSLMSGTEVEFTVTVRPALFEPETAITRLTADLSALGGPSAVLLNEVEDGVYQFGTRFAVNGPNGLKEISVMIDQDTSVGSHWIHLLKRIAVLPGEDVWLFGDEVAEGWSLEGSSRVTLATAAGGYRYQGQSSLELQGEEGRNWTVKFVAAEPVSQVGFKALHFAFHPGDAMLPEGGQFRVAAVGTGFTGMDLLSEASSMSVDLGLSNWQVVEIPLEAFEARGSIISVRLTGNLEGTFYLDDIRLVAAEPPASITAVTEEHTVTLPQAFILDQNYPNPFNSATVIRFSLPTAADVDLAIFNLAGQRVATLADGVRAAGSYTLRWDGRDDDGRALASGVYLYRLRTGDEQQVETRKLLLMK